MKNLLKILIVITVISCSNESQIESNDHQPNTRDLFGDEVSNILKSRNLKVDDFIEENSSKGEKVNSTESSKSFLQQKFITVNDQLISYYETKSKGPKIFMIHGNVLS